tara:strand:- start:4080 stop:4763 length:684 start_codon:yes stop_codon:yes gene_type:complete
MRIAKFISNAGICSRRNAEKLILEGKVIINNKICDKPNINVNLNDKILVNNKIISINKSIRVWKMYKPIKTICSNNDPQKRKTVFDLMPSNLPRLISIGRLDFMSEGLLLFTNNGDIARKFELPSSNLLRVYRVCLNGIINKQKINRINSGLTIEGIHYNKIKIEIEKSTSNSTWVLFKLLEGKNREIRNICKYFKWKITRLIRVQYGNIKLSKLKPGNLVEIKNYL